MREHMELLNKLVLDEDRIATAAYVIRHTNLHASEVQSLLRQFLSENPKLQATYYIIGQQKKVGADDIKRCLIVKQENLEQAKTCFERILLCNIYSVHRNPIKGLETLFNVDWLEERSDIAKVPSKTLIKSLKAEESYNRWVSINSKFKTISDGAYHQQQQEIENREEPSQNPIISQTLLPETSKTKNKTTKNSNVGTQMKISNFFNRQ